jgi:hypothetical protein
MMTLGRMSVWVDIQGHHGLYLYLHLYLCLLLLSLCAQAAR